MKRTTFSSTIVSATAPMAVVSAPAGRSGRRTTWSLTTPAAPATRNATSTDTPADQPNAVLTT